MRCAVLPMFAALACGPVWADGDKVLLGQKNVVHLKVTDRTQRVEDPVIHLEPRQAKATAVCISGWVRTRGVQGVRGSNFLVVTNLTYPATPIFWYTILYPQTGTHPWQYVEKLVRSRLPIQKIDMTFRLRAVGEAWFRDFKVEEVPSWREDADLVVATLGDSTGVMAYMPDEYTVWYQLENLLRDRFADHHVRVRCLAESGEYLKRLLASGRLDRELATLGRCDVMVIRYGLNDCGKRVPPPEFKQQFLDVCTRVKKRFPKVRIVPATTIPPSADVYDVVTRELALERGLPIIDLNAFLRREATRGNGNWHTGPGQEVGYRTEKNPAKDPSGLRGNKHPNAYGAALIAAEKFRVLEPIVAELLKVNAR